MRPALWVDLDYFTTENQELTIADAEVGDYITFGSYEPAGGEEIEWLVLEKNDKKALVISKYALYRMKYNLGDEDTTWEDCTLRKWLNSEFIDVTFSEDEKAKLPTVTVPASRNPEYDTNPGNSTEDKVYLLSIDEVNRYFDSDEEKRCLATAYATESDSETQKATEGYCSGWYLRTPGDSPIFVACVNVKGNINVGGACTYYINGYYIRPALWISLE